MTITILTAAIITYLIRVLPIIMQNKSSILQNRKLVKFLDYMICMITGEIVFNIAFGDIKITDYNIIILTLVTLIIASFIMWKTDKLSLSMIIAIGSFILMWLTL